MYLEAEAAGAVRLRRWGTSGYHRRVLEAILRADTREFRRDLDQAEGKMSKFGRPRSWGLWRLGGAIAYGLGKVAKIGWDEFNEGQKVRADERGVEVDGVWRT